ncbi:MAG: L-threonylcarbamoyladenylate synthase [Gammaproteobacteria bacterium]|jgi:tRNA threonylcarbamoyl adenosine modification protein (Sua5/YciO/YrdC/YwlC family)
MSQYFHIHPQNPQVRLINQAVEIIRDGGVVVYPTDSVYAIGCHLNDKKALDRIKLIRNLSGKHNFTLMCRDLSEIATYAKVNNPKYRLLKSLTPGPYTFILSATKDVPVRLQHPKKKTIGIRVPDCRITLDILETLNEPLMSVTVILPKESMPLYDPKDIYQRIGSQVDLVIDGGPCAIEYTSVIDLTNDNPIVIRQGKGDTSFLS